MNGLNDVAMIVAELACLRWPRREILTHSSQHTSISVNSYLNRKKPQSGSGEKGVCVCVGGVTIQIQIQQ